MKLFLKINLRTTNLVISAPLKQDNAFLHWLNYMSKFPLKIEFDFVLRATEVQQTAVSSPTATTASLSSLFLSSTLSGSLPRAILPSTFGIRSKAEPSPSWTMQRWLPSTSSNRWIRPLAIWSQPPPTPRSRSSTPGFVLMSPSTRWLLPLVTACIFSH